MLVSYCFVGLVLLSIFSVFCVTSFGDGTHPQHQPKKLHLLNINYFLLLITFITKMANLSNP